MKRQSAGAAFELSIHGDQLENDRINLEHNLQNTELSFRLSSTSDEDEGPSRNHHRRHNHQHDSSIEYPRHLSEPSLPEFPSFAAHHRSRDDFGGEDELSHSHAHGWSYRTHDDDEGINPYGAHSMSTAAHHASALTLSAGLGGGRAARRDISLSGAEYDPDRPLHAIMAGVNSKQHSMFDLDPSKTHITHEPIVVDSTAELDRILESGHAPPGSIALPSSLPNHLNPLSPISSSSPSASDSDGGVAHRPRNRHPGTGLSPRPKLSDHLRHVSFSPKRPHHQRSPGPGSPLQLNLDVRRRADYSHSDDGEEDRLPTPRAATRRLASDTRASAAATSTKITTTAAAGPKHPTTTSRGTAAAPQADVRVNVHPATPSSAGSKFTRMARGITRELEATQVQLRNARAASTGAGGDRPPQVDRERNPFHEPPPSPAQPQFRTTTAATTTGHARRSSLKPPRTADVTAGTSTSRVYLPDVTGLTSAVESPAKPGVQYQAYRGDLMRPRESEVRLVQTLAAVQGQLEALEEENGISRRRVRELEMELEECKREVARERTRLFDRSRQRENDLSLGHGDNGNNSARNINMAGPSGKGKARAREMSEERMHTRYKEAVNEKKALEALITSLRTHLTRLTAELSKHSTLLGELRTLRDSDAAGLRAKGAEILALRAEVQRLAGEVEVLRGVVEEGLKERRASREGIVVDDTRDGGAQQEEEEEEAEETFRQQRNQTRNMLEEDDEDAADEDYVPPSRSVSRATFSEDEGEADEDEDEDDETDDSEPEPFDPVSLSSPINRAAERTMRTDRATIGASSASGTPVLSGAGTTRLPATRVTARREEATSRNTETRDTTSRDTRSRARRQQQQPVVDETELSMIAAELEERRANRSVASIASASVSIRGAGSPVRRRATVRNASDNEEVEVKRPEAPTPGHATRRYGSPLAEQETPFPQIRGERLERLFFSAPEHNARTCTVCDRRRRQGGGGPRDRARDNEDDEGYEGSEGADAELVGRAGSGAGQISVVFSTDAAHWQAVGRAQGLPAQTVVARVVRELEDDFTHYKSIYVELADQYKVMDAASDVRRRNTLAKHLREVVDVLELKGDKISALYEMLRLK